MKQRLQSERQLRFVWHSGSARPGLYATSDEAVQDQDGQSWVLERADDVINVAAHRIGTMEIEGAVAAALPKARAGKLMRRLLREAAETGAVRGDLTGLEDPLALQAVLDAVNGR